LLGSPAQETEARRVSAIAESGYEKLRRMSMMSAHEGRTRDCAL